MTTIEECRPVARRRCRSFRGAWIAAAVIAAAAIAAYHNSLSGPFIFDDVRAIENGNPTIRHLWHLSQVLSPPDTEGQTVGGRPVLNLTLALNYAFGGVRVTGYHVANLLIHVSLGLALFGLIRRTLAAVGSRGNPEGTVAGGGSRSSATLRGGIITLLWVVHPLASEAVTYVIQRAESLVSLFYILTLYCFARAAERDSHGAKLGAVPERKGPSGRPAAFWYALSWIACLAGMGTKEVMATAPIAVVLYDRTFVAGSLAEALRRRRGWYLALAATWLLLARLAFGTHDRGGTASLGAGVFSPAHVATQIYALAHYLRLVFWPSPLLFDYGTFRIDSWRSVAPEAVLLASLMTATGIGLTRNRRWGFAGALFFLILAPSTLAYIPLQTMAEHRMYLALVVVVATVVIAVDVLASRFAGRTLARCITLAWCLPAVGLGWMTVQRNNDYRSELSIWQDTVAKHPTGSSRANYNYGVFLSKAGRLSEAIAQFRASLRLEPDRVEAHDNLANALFRAGRVKEAILEYGEALRLAPSLAEAHYNFGLALYSIGRLDDSARQLEESLRLAPNDPDAHTNLGNALFGLGRISAAAGQYEEALRLDPNQPEAHNNLGSILEREGRFPAAKAEFETALRLRPDYATARANLERLDAAAVK